YYYDFKFHLFLYKKMNFIGIKNIYHCINIIIIYTMPKKTKTKSVRLSAEIRLPYFKQGDDMHGCIVKDENGKVDIEASFNDDNDHDHDHDNEDDNKNDNKEKLQTSSYDVTI